MIKRFNATENNIRALAVFSHYIMAVEGCGLTVTVKKRSGRLKGLTVKEDLMAATTLFSNWESSDIMTIWVAVPDEFLPILSLALMLTEISGPNSESVIISEPKMQDSSPFFWEFLERFCDWGDDDG